MTSLLDESLAFSAAISGAVLFVVTWAVVLSTVRWMVRGVRRAFDPDSGYRDV